MSSFLYRLGRVCFRRHWRVIVIWTAILAIAGGSAAALMSKFDDQFTLPGTQSQAALNQLKRTFPEVAGASATLIVVAPEGKTVDDPNLKKAIADTITTLSKRPDVNTAHDPFDTRVAGLISEDRTAAMVQIMMRGDLVDFTPEQKDNLATETATITKEVPGAQASLGGELYNADVPQVGVTEGVGLLVAVLVLMVTFGSLITATFPLVSALTAVGIAMLGILASTGLATVNSTTPMLALMLGLALGIDYALFILSRHRDQLGEGVDVEESAAQAVGTAGSAVVFAGLTNLIALVGLSVANIPFLTVMGLAAAVTVAIVIAVSLTLIPALCGLAGERIRPRKARNRTRHEAPKWRTSGGRVGGGAAGWWVRLITRVPLATVVVIVSALIALAIPFKDIHLALPNASLSPPGSSARVTYDLVSKHFGPGFNGPLIVTADIIESKDPLGVMDGLKRDIEKMDGVKMVALATPNRTADTGIVQIVPEAGPDDDRTEALVNAIRARAAEWKDTHGTDTAVTGFTALAIDVSARLGSALVPFGIFTVGLSLILLTVVFRSLAIPIKTALTFLLSVLAAFGATTMVFGYGWFASLINLHDIGPVISFTPIITMAVLFGLAMDYEVFLVSRMREDYVRSGDAHAAVRTGYIASSKVVIAAAIIMFAVFAFFVPEGNRASLKPIAVALAVGVAIDAFVVRMTLVPALLYLLGDKAWYLPKWLDKKLPHFDVEGESLHHQLEHADWPADAQRWSVYTEGLGIGEGDETLFADVDIHLQPGDVLVVEGEPRQRTALLLALSGRMRADAGEARVLGHLLPEDSGGLRKQTTLIDAVSDRNLMGNIHSADQLLVVDRADALPSAVARRSLAEQIAAASSTGRTVVLGALAAEHVADLCPNGYYRLTLQDTTLAKTVEARP